MKKIFVPLIAAAMAIFGAVVGSGTAGATQIRPFYEPSSQYVCDLGDLNCIQHSAGGLTTVSPGNLGNDDKFTAVISSDCGGSVTTSCPSLPGSLNSTYSGDDIVCMQSHAGGYMKGNGGGSFITIEANCNGNDNYWIVNANTFVNVADTIGGGVPRYLTEQNNFHVVDMGGVTDQTRWTFCASC